MKNPDDVCAPDFSLAPEQADLAAADRARFEGQEEVPQHKPRSSPLPEGAQARKQIPMARGLLDYFPGALAEVAEVSRIANDQHSPGEEMHWARGKSTDHADTILRHLVDRGKRDTDGLRHTAKIAWRALALLQEELEMEGSPPGRASRFRTVYEVRALATTQDEG